MSFQKMKPSKYNIFVKDGDSVYAVNLLSRAAIELSIDAYETLNTLMEKSDCSCISSTWNEDPDLRSFMKTLIDGMFILDDGFDELAYIRYRSHQERFDNSQLGLVITPTMGCNFSCHYCFENKTDTYLSEDAQARILQLVASNIVGRENLSVQWFGGEPLRALDIIEKLSRKFISLSNAAGARYAATVITNGYLMTKDVSHLLNELGVRTVQISLDGDRSLHNRTRYEQPGKGSFDTILENIRHASKLLSIKVRVHVAPFNLKSVQQLIDTLGQEGMAEHISQLYFAPLFNYKPNMQGQAYQPDGIRFMTSQEFATIQIDLLRRASKWGFTVPDFLDASYGICTAVRGNTLVIDASGNLLKCYKDVGVTTESIGTVETGPKPNQNLMKWMDIQIPRDEECRDCQFLPICLGGCSKQWQENASKDVICTPLKFNADEMIRLYFHMDKQKSKHLEPPKNAPLASRNNDGDLLD
jgi:uncharacterized protein